MAQHIAADSLSATRLWAVARAQLAGMMSSFDQAEVLLRERTLLGLSGGPSADFNLCLVDDSPNVEVAIRESVERTRTRRLSALFMLSGRASARLQGHPEALGLMLVGEAPLMVFDGALPFSEARYPATRVFSEPEMREVAALIADAFQLDPAWVGRTFASQRAIEASCGADFYVVRNEGIAVSTVTVTGSGRVLGIWSMATDPGFQRRGAGRTALEHAMAEKRALGAQAFYLIATPAGKPLYDTVGFKTVESIRMYALGSTE